MNVFLTICNHLKDAGVNSKYIKDTKTLREKNKHLCDWWSHVCLFTLTFPKLNVATGDCSREEQQQKSPLAKDYRGHGLGYKIIYCALIMHGT